MPGEKSEITIFGDGEVAQKDAAIVTCVGLQAKMKTGVVAKQLTPQAVGPAVAGGAPAEAKNP